MVSVDDSNMDDKRPNSDSNTAFEIPVGLPESVSDVSHPTPIEIILASSYEAEER